MPNKVVRDISSPPDIEAVFRRHFAMVYRLCYSYLGSAADAEDAAQGVFMKLLDHPRGFEDEGHEKAWLIVCAANLCKDELKSARRERTVGMSESMDAVMGESDHLDETVDAVLRLPAKYKDCVYMHYYEGYKTAEIARMLGIPASTVRNRLRDGRALLKTALRGA